MKIRTGDNVRIIAWKYQWVTDEEGNKTRFEGTVTRVYNNKDQVLIEWANIIKRHMKKQWTVPGRIVEMEKPIPISNVMLICPHTNEPTRIGIERKDGKKFRISKKANKRIDK